MDFKNLQFWQILVLFVLAAIVILIVFMRGKFKLKLKDREIQFGGPDEPITPGLTKPCNNCPIALNLATVIQKVFSTAVTMATIELKTMKEKQYGYAQIKLGIYTSTIIQKYKETLFELGISDPQLDPGFLFFRYLYLELIDEILEQIKKALDINGILEYTEEDYQHYIKRQIHTNKNYLTEFLDTRYIGALTIGREKLNAITETVTYTFDEVITDIFIEMRHIGLNKEAEIQSHATKLIEYIEGIAGIKLTDFEVKKS